MDLKLLCIRESSGAALDSPEKIRDLMREEGKADRECMWVLHLNQRSKLIEKELVSMGTINAAIVRPREVFKKAILNSTVNIITVHNHPSGDSEPSEDDIKIWNQLRNAGEIIGIPILDNLIITLNGKFYSEHNDKR